jgi:hypothetical protein
LHGPFQRVANLFLVFFHVFRNLLNTLMRSGLRIVVL